MGYHNEGSMLFVAILWGCTNPLIKRYTAGIKQVQAETRLKQFRNELMFLFTNIGYLIPMATNQLGSVLYYFTLQNSKLSSIVPVTNSLTFLFTTITSIVLGEKLPSKKASLGMFLIFLGAVCCFLDKS